MRVLLLRSASFRKHFLCNFSPKMQSSSLDLSLESLSTVCPPINVLQSLSEFANNLSLDLRKGASEIKGHVGSKRGTYILPQLKYLLWGEGEMGFSVN